MRERFAESAAGTLRHLKKMPSEGPYRALAAEGYSEEKVVYAVVAIAVVVVVVHEVNRIAARSARIRT
jgi:hypothetical protein